MNDKKLWLLPNSKKPKKRIVGVFSDTHFPFVHPNYLKFLVDTFIYYKVTDIICTGDLVDNHAISRHQTEVDAMGGVSEYTLAKKYVKQYIKTFPKLKLCLGNHDRIPQRQGATLGLHTGFMKSFEESWNLPKGWKISDQFIFNNVLYDHYGSGKDGAINRALVERTSTVTGHTHSWANIKYTANNRSLIFGMNVGCGIDVVAYAFAYGKQARYKPNLACGIVISDCEAYLIPMGKKYFRSNEEVK